MSNIRVKAVSVLRVAFVTISAAAAIGCSSKPTVGDQILAQGKDTAAIGTRWNQANQMIATGQGLADRGRQQIKDGQDSIRKGDAMVSKGRVMMAEAEAQYKAAQAHPRPVAMPAAH